MDSEDETIRYFKLLNDSSGNYLIQNNYELQDCLSQEPIFTEIETGTWSSEAFPILLNSSSVNESSSQDSLTQKVKDKTSATQVQGVDSSQHYSTQDGTITLRVTHESQPDERNEALLVANGNTYELIYSNEESAESHCHESKDFANNVDKDLVNFSNDNIWNEFHGIITARKCKVCSFICESLEEMIDHLNDAHEDLIKLKQEQESRITKSNNIKVEQKMTSILDPNKSILKNTTISVCSMCDESFATKKLMVQHLLKTHIEEDKSESNENELMKNIPNETPTNSTRKLEITLLRNQQRSKKKLKCSVNECTLKFSDNETKLRHQECHVPNGKHFQCPECKENFTVWRLCCKHLWTCHKIDAGLYSCPICNKYKSNSPVLLMNHIDIHNHDKPFVCTECGKGFKQVNQLRNHKIIHDRKLKSPSSKTRCNICERFFANNKCLKKHIETVHDKIKPFICNLCGHKTSRKSMLELHYRRHTGEKPHHCPHCTYKTSDHNCLRRHVMKHFSCMKYFCPYCEYQAIQSSAYKNHLNAKHPGAEEIFKCGYCAFTSLKFDSYQTHIKCHEHEYKMKGKGGDDSEVLTIGDSECEDIETQVYLHVSKNCDLTEDIENIDEPNDVTQ